MKDSNGDYVPTPEALAMDTNSPIAHAANIIGELGIVQFQGRRPLDISDISVSLSIPQLLDLAGRILVMLATPGIEGMTIRHSLSMVDGPLVLHSQTEYGGAFAPDVKPNHRRRK